ncbi:hypothetical protein C2845_PM05G07960 [Panicum miliaceum]|uniref:RWP-RK domain-containing protein n=1 Tax=Panicum miliaceum TaxID=4540 RepID=A0A3L6T1V2_PANMI|nr:hypothetical protein C2845_PM05G07960 [Panicum miliaceum]
MADGHGEATDWEGPYDPLLVQDDYDDVMYLLDMPAAVLDPAPLALAAQDNLLEWPATLYNDSVGSRAPTHDAAVAGGRPVISSTQYVGAGTPATASTSAAAAHDENVFDCSGCHVLREVLHSNGLEATKLCVHGAAGLFYHATLEVYRINCEGLATALTHQSYIEGRDYVWVKHYLTDYAQQRAGGGYTVVHDSISAFHDALCVSMNYGGNAAGDDRREGMQMAVAAGNGGGGGGDQEQQELAGATDAAAAQHLIDRDVPAAAGPSEPSAGNKQDQREVPQVGRSALAIQRKRASNLQLGDLARYFHLPMTQAARHLGVCATVLKTTSRRFHVPRWPHRKVLTSS